MPIAGSRRAGGDDALTIMVDNIVENNSFRHAAERRALYGTSNPLWDPEILRKLQKQRIEEAASKKLLLWPGWLGTSSDFTNKVFRIRAWFLYKICLCI